MDNSQRTFKTDEPFLSELLKDVHRLQLQLPDFQRSWIWDDHHIRDLIASVSQGYPIGAIMLLKTGVSGIRMKSRPLEGAPVGSADAQALILDGQQRLTSLYLTLKSGKPVLTRNDKKEPITRVYFLDIQRCLDPSQERLDAVISVPESLKLTSDFARKVDLDVSTKEHQYDVGLFPLSLVLDSQASRIWQSEYRKHHRQTDEASDLVDRFAIEVLAKIERYQLPVLELLAETPKEAVCQVFERVNTGGVSLTVFDLVTASFAADNFELRRDWEERVERLRPIKVLEDFDSTDFLTSVTLYSSLLRHRQSKTPLSCKRKDVLKLALDDYRQHREAVETGLKSAAQFLARLKVFDARNLPYKTQLIPMAAICAALGHNFDTDPVKHKLARWYWCGVFGELYGGANESRYANDVQDVVAWIDGGAEPRTIRDASFAPVRLATLQSRSSAAYKGVAARLMDEGSEDFLSGDPIELTTFFDLAIDIHHVFPASYCEKQGYDRRLWNSIVNKAPASSRSNRVIGGHAPSKYLQSIERNHKLPPERLDAILESHLISAARLRQDDFLGFIQNRATRLLDLIEEAMGKQVTGRESDEVVATFRGPLTGTPRK